MSALMLLRSRAADRIIDECRPGFCGKSEVQACALTAGLDGDWLHVSILVKPGPQRRRQDAEKRVAAQCQFCTAQPTLL